MEFQSRARALRVPTRGTRPFRNTHAYSLGYSHVINDVVAPECGLCELEGDRMT